jgi:hypothetical protein
VNNWPCAGCARRLGVAEFRSPRQAEQGFFLALADDVGGAAHFVGKVGGTVGEQDLAAPQFEHVLRTRGEFDAVDRLGQEVGGTGIQGGVGELRAHGRQ